MRSNVLAFLSDFEQQLANQEKLEKDSAARFNVFRLLEIERLEPAFHSKMLGDFLNPAGSHGQGPLFLTEFLEVLRSSGMLKVVEPDGQGYFMEREIK
jgi:hypothetical protein